jgi:transposase
MDKYRVALTLEERAELEHLVSAGKAAARKLTHARILLLADAAVGGGQTDDAIVAALNVGPRTIARVRQRLVTEGFRAALERKPQPPRPDKIKIKGDVEQELVRIACTDPPRGCGHWTLELLAGQLVALGLLKSVSTETVRSALKKTISTPGSSRPGVCRPTPMASSSGAWKT